MRALLLVHVLAGAVALVSGYLALSVAKGSSLHRKSGLWFVYSMVTMGALAVVINLFEGEEWTGGLLVAYFVLSALEAVRPEAERRRWLEMLIPLLAMPYWTWRLRRRTTTRRLVGSGASG